MKFKNLPSFKLKRYLQVDSFPLHVTRDTTIKYINTFLDDFCCDFS